AVIATEDEGQRAFLQRLQRAVVQLLAHLGDVADVFLRLVSRPLHFWNRRREIALVYRRTSECGNLIANAGNAKGRRPHVHAASTGAEIEGDSDHMDRLHVNYRSLYETDIPSEPGDTTD